MRKFLVCMFVLAVALSASSVFAAYDINSPIVNVNAGILSLGSTVATWANQGSSGGNFTVQGGTGVTVADVVDSSSLSYRAVKFPGTTGNWFKLVGNSALPTAIYGTATPAVKPVYTVAVWVYTPTLPGNRANCYCTWTFGDHGAALYYTNGMAAVDHWKAYSPNVSLAQPATTDWLAGKWHHLAITNDGTTEKLFVDGVVKKSLTLSATGYFGSTSSDVRIGQDEWNAGTNAFMIANSAIGSLRIYDSACADTAVSALMTDMIPTIPTSTFTITATAGVGGTVTPAGTATIVPGLSQTYTITPDAVGYAIGDVKVDNVSQGAISTYTFTNVQANHTIDVTFNAIPTATITTSVTGNGTITPAATATVNAGTSPVYTISPTTPGNVISDVVVDGVSKGAIASYTFSSITAGPHTIAVTFATVPTATITTSVTGNGIISPAGTATVNAGTSPVYTISTYPGNIISDVVVDGVSKGAITSYTFTGIAEGTHTIAATFASNGDLVARYKFDETTGTVAADSSPNNLTATLSGGCTWIAGKYDNAINFGGANGYAIMPNGIASGLTDFTIATWVNLTLSPNWSRIFDIGSGLNQYMFLTANDGTGKMRYDIKNGGADQFLLSPVALPTGSWVHVAVVVSGDTTTLYQNGIAVASTTAITIRPSNLGTTTQSWIGRSQYAADPYLNGKVDDFRIYQKALTNTDIVEVMTGGVRTISGTIVDASSNLTYPATVKLMQAGSVVQTLNSADGTFSFIAGPGVYSVEASRPFAKAVAPVDADATSGDVSGLSITLLDYKVTVNVSDSSGPLANALVRLGGPSGIASVTDATGQLDLDVPTAGANELYVDAASHNASFQTINYVAGVAQTIPVTLTTNPSEAGVYNGTFESNADGWQTYADKAGWLELERLGNGFPDANADMYLMSQSSSLAGNLAFGVPHPRPGVTWPPMPHTYSYTSTIADLTENTLTDTSATWTTFNTGFNNWGDSIEVVGTDGKTRAYPIRSFDAIAKTITLVPGATLITDGLGIGSTYNVTTDVHRWWYPGYATPTADKRIPVSSDHAYNFYFKMKSNNNQGTPCNMLLWRNAAGNELRRDVVNWTPGATMIESDPRVMVFGPLAAASVEPVFGIVDSGTTLGEFLTKTGGIEFDDVVVDPVKLPAITGKVTLAGGTTPVPNATITAVSGATTLTAQTAADGTYLIVGSFNTAYTVSAAKGDYTVNTAPQVVALAGSDVINIDFTLEVGPTPAIDDLLFAGRTEALPANGEAIPSWPALWPSGVSFTSISTPTVTEIDGAKWVANSNATGTGFHALPSTDTVVVNGATIVVAVQPVYEVGQAGDGYQEVVSVLLNKLSICVNKDDGLVRIGRGAGIFGPNFTTGYYVPDGQKTILSLVVQPTGEAKLYANGLQVWSTSTTYDMTTLTATAWWNFDINIGKGWNGDNWSSFNGNIGDVFVYKAALTDNEVSTLEQDLGNKFGVHIPTFTTISGKVTTEDGVTPLPGAQILDSGNPSAASALSGEDGTYSLKVETGTDVYLSAVKDNYLLVIPADGQYFISIGNDPVENVDFGMTPTNTITGIVKDVNGNPIYNAIVQFGDIAAPAAITDKDGKYTLSGITPGYGEIYADALGYADSTENIDSTPAANGPFSWDITLTSKNEVGVIKNGGFENVTAGKPDNWTITGEVGADANFSSTSVAGEFVSGTYGVKFTPVASKYEYLTQVIPVIAESTYNVYFKSKGDAGATGVFPFVLFNNQGWGEGEMYNGWMSTAPTAWTQFVSNNPAQKTRFSVPAGATAILVQLGVTDAFPAGKSLYFDDVVVDRVGPDPTASAITASAGAGGSISPSGDVVVEWANNQTFTITPNSGYAIEDVLVDGVSNAAAIASGSYIFSMVNASHTIAATFVAVVTGPTYGANNKSVLTDNKLVGKRVKVWGKIVSKDATSYVISDGYSTGVTIAGNTTLAIGDIAVVTGVVQTDKSVTP